MPAKKSDSQSKPDSKSFMDVVCNGLKKQVEKVGGFIGTPSELEHLHAPVGYIKTGIYGLDIILSLGNGVPYGRFIEVQAPEGVGKTALAEYLMGAVKRVGGLNHYLDTERTQDLNHVRCYGVEEGEFLSPDLPDLESVWDYARGVVRLLREQNAKNAKASQDREKVNLIILDSLAATPARAELTEKSHSDSHVGLQARANAKGCVDGDAIVVTEKGEVKELKHVRTGDRIPSMTKTGKIVWRTVKRCWSTGVNETIDIGGLCVTADHPIPVYREEGVVYVRADAVLRGDFIPLPRNMPISLHRAAVKDVRAAWLYGVIAGDGTFNKVGGSQLCAADVGIQLAATDILKDFDCDLVKSRAWPPKFRTVKSKDYTGKENRWRRFLASIDSRNATGRDKDIPPKLFMASEAVTASLLAGLVDTDGSVSAINDAINYCSVSRHLAYQVWLLALRFGAPGTIYEVHAPCHHYLIYWHGDNARRLLCAIKPYLCGDKASQSDRICRRNGGSVQSDLMPDALAAYIKSRLTVRQVRAVIPSIHRPTSYPEWSKPGRVRVDRDTLRTLGEKYKDARMCAEADSDVWWRRVEPMPGKKVETFDVEMEWDDRDGEPNFMVGGMFVHNCRCTTRDFSDSSAIFLFINQLRDKIGAFGHGPKTETPGGRALRYAYAIRLKLAKIKSLKNSADKPLGHLVEVSTIKNKHAPPNLKTVLYLSYDRGIDRWRSNFMFLQEYGYIQPAGKAGFRWKGDTNGDVFKASSFKAYALAHKDAINAACAEICKKMTDSVESASDE